MPPAPLGKGQLELQGPRSRVCGRPAVACPVSAFLPCGSPWGQRYSDRSLSASSHQLHSPGFPETSPHLRRPQWLSLPPWCCPPPLPLPDCPSLGPLPPVPFWGHLGPCLELGPALPSRIPSLVLTLPCSPPAPTTRGPFVALLCPGSGPLLRLLLLPHLLSLVLLSLQCHCHLFQEAFLALPESIAHQSPFNSLSGSPLNRQLPQSRAPSARCEQSLVCPVVE